MKKRACQILLLVLTVSSASGQITNSNAVATILAQALTRASQLVTNPLAVGHDPSHFFTNNPVVAVVDLEGFVLGARSLFPDPNPLDTIDAITKAGTAAFLSSDQNAFSSRTAGFIVQQHFPPGIRNRPPGPLVGVNFSNLSFSDVNRFKDPATYDPLASALGGTNGAPITPLTFAALSGLAGSPGGVPLYQQGQLIGGVGAAVTGHPPIPELYDVQQTARQTADLDEDVALAGQLGFQPAKQILGSEVFIDGIRVPYVNTSTKLDTNALLPSPGFAVPSLVSTNPYETVASPPVSYPATNLGGIHGEMRAPFINDPMPGSIGGAARLTVSDVTNILTLAAKRASITRAGIRLPRGQPAQVFISVVNNPNQPGVSPVILGTFRTPEATIFSWDVSVQKARTALYFSATNQAYSCRTVGFLAQSLYPPGIANTAPGPVLGLQENFSLLGLAAPFLPTGITNILNGVYFTTNSPSLTSPDPNLPNGITIFPGGFPLYRNGQLIGAIGVSGDGVDQDDIIAASGTVSNLPPDSIRADQTKFRNARLPYAKFPRNPSL